MDLEERLKLEKQVEEIYKKSLQGRFDALADAWDNFTYEVIKLVTIILDAITKLIKRK